MELINVDFDDRCLCAMGVRTDVPFNQLTDEEKNIVYYGPAEKNIFFIRLKIQIMQEKWILLILMQLIQ